MNTADTDDDGAVRRKHLIVKRTVMSVTVFPSQCRFDELPAREGFPMRLMALLTALALVGLLTGSQAYAEEMLAWGGGTAACAKINPLIPPGTGWGNDVLTGGMMDWMQGFISGINITAFERKKYYNLKAISIDEQWDYVIDFCHRNPDKRFYQAVLDLIAKRLEVPPVAPAQ